MKRIMFLLPVLAAGFGGGLELPAAAPQVKDPPPPVFKGQTPPAPAPAPAADPAPAGSAPTAAATAGAPAPPPSASAKRSAAELEKLVAPLALFPDPLIATMLPASVYPLEIVQAARFVADTNNLSKLDAQPWDDNVKAVARIPDAIKKMNDDLSWTVELGDAFLAQDKDVMDAIQNLRGKAQKAGTLQTTPQQVVVVTNLVVMQTNTTQVVTVTNQVVQIQPANPSVVYVPTYNPTTVYYPPPAYVYDPIAPLVTFTAGVAMGAIIANNCDWWHGGCYHGDVDIDVDRNVNRNVNRNTDRTGNRASQTGARASTTQKKWQPDQGRLRTSGSSGAAASARTSEARGWSGGGARPSTQPAGGARPAGGGARPSTGTPSARPSTGGASGNRPSTAQSGSRPSPSAGTSANRPSPSANRSSSTGSAFSGASSGASARSSSSRGAASRGGGGGRGGGGRR